MLQDMYLVRSNLSGQLPSMLEKRTDNVIGPQGLLATKARVLVTNNVAYLKYFDQVIYLRRGIILEQGPYNVLMENPDSEVRKLV